MRQYYILYRRGLSGNWSKLNSQDHASLYARDEVAQAIAFIAANSHVEGVAIRLDDEMFNIVSFVQDAEAPSAFVFPAA